MQLIRKFHEILEIFSQNFQENSWILGENFTQFLKEFHAIWKRISRNF